MNFLVNLRLNSQLEEDAARGILATLINEMEGVMSGRQRSNFFVDFYRVRLNSIEKREVLWLIKQISLQIKGQGSLKVVNESHTNPPSDDLGESYLKVLNYFRQKGGENGSI